MLSTTYDNVVSKKRGYCISSVNPTTNQKEQKFFLQEKQLEIEIAYQLLESWQKIQAFVLEENPQTGKMTKRKIHVSKRIYPRPKAYRYYMGGRSNNR